MNLPWAYDGYSPTDTTLLDMHHGTLDDWRKTIAEIHKRDMYVLMDNTVATYVDVSHPKIPSRFRNLPPNL